MAEEPDDPLKLAREIAAAYRAGREPESGPRRPAKRRFTPKRPGRDDPTPLSDVLGELVEQQGWTDQLAAQRVFTDWSGIVGPQIAQHSRVEGFADGIVQIAASSTAWAKELTMLAPQIVAKLNAALGDGSVLRIDVKGPQAPTWAKGRRTVRGARGPRDTFG